MSDYKSNDLPNSVRRLEKGIDSLSEALEWNVEIARDRHFCKIDKRHCGLLQGHVWPVVLWVES